MQITTPDLHANDVVRAYRNTEGLHTLYGTWRPSEIKKKTWSLHETEPSNTLAPSQLLLEISDGRRFVIDEPCVYEERAGEFGTAWTQVRGRPSIRTEHGLKPSIPFDRAIDGEPAEPPRPGKWWRRD